MKQFSHATILLSTFFFVSCATHQPSPRSDIEADYVVVEFTADDDDLSFWDMPLLEKAVIDTAPPDRKDGLVVGELGLDAGNKDMIVKLANEIGEGQHANYDSLLIAHQGKLLFESYYLRGRVNATHPQASTTKAYTSLALGRAIQLGYLPMADLDKPLVSFLGALDRAKFVEGVEKITLHQALTMRGRLRISEQQQEQFEKNPIQLQGQGLVQTLFEQSAPVTPESRNFSYGNHNPTLVMQVINAVVPGGAAEFIKNELFQKMGITTYSWQADLSGLPTAGSRSSITSRAMVKLGPLAMNKGQWKGEQLISEAFIAKATSRIITIGDDDMYGGGKDVSNQGYGYFWWSSDLTRGNKRYINANAQAVAVSLLC